MSSKSRVAISLACLVTFSVIAADAGLDLFNSKKNQVQSNQTNRATSENSGTSSVGTGSHWEETVQDELNSFKPNTSSLEAKLRSEFTSADGQLTTTINSTKSQLSSFKSTTSSNLSNLSASIDSKLASFKSSSNSTISSYNSKATQLSSSVNLADTKIAALWDRVNALQTKIDGASCSSTWEVVYEGNGTNTLTLPSGWSKYRISYSYYGSDDDGSRTTYHNVFRTEGGSYGDSVGGVASGTNFASCKLAEEPSWVQTDNKEVVQAGTITWETYVTARRNQSLRPCPNDAVAFISQFTITKFEIQY